VAFPLTVFAATRLFAGLVTSAAAVDQRAFPNPESPGVHAETPIPANPGYWAATTNWDGQWYWTIAEHGYPEELPLGAGGAVERSPWAFYPLYPMLVRLVMAITRLPFEYAAPGVSMLAGAVGVALLHTLLLRLTGTFVARATTAAVCCYASAPVLQYAYPESLALLLLVGALSALAARRWALFLALAVLLALTRPVVVALAVALVAAALLPWPGERRIPAADRRRWLLLGVAVGLTSLLWPAIAAVRTGRWDAYLVTARAWTTQNGGIVPGIGVLSERFGPITAPAFALFALAVLAMALRPGAAAWGVPLRAWAVGYPAYLVGMTVPGASHPRYWLLSLVWLWPFPDALRTDSSTLRVLRRVLLGVVVVGGLAAQVWWIRDFWIPHRFTP